MPISTNTALRPFILTLIENPIGINARCQLIVRLHCIDTIKRHHIVVVVRSIEPKINVIRQVCPFIQTSFNRFTIKCKRSRIFMLIVRISVAQGMSSANGSKNNCRRCICPLVEAPASRRNICRSISKHTQRNFTCRIILLQPKINAFSAVIYEFKVNTVIRSIFRIRRRQAINVITRIFIDSLFECLQCSFLVRSRRREIIIISLRPSTISTRTITKNRGPTMDILSRTQTSNSAVKLFRP